MTVPTTVRLKEHPGDGVLTVFSYPFKIFSSDSLIVTLIVDSTGVETIKTISTHYTVDGVGAPGGGNATMITAPATGETLRVERTPEFVQQTDLRNQGNFTPQQVENMGDHLMHCIQALSAGAMGGGGGHDNTIYTDTGPDNRPTAGAANLNLSYTVQNPAGWMRRETIYRKKDGVSYARRIEWTSHD